MAFFDNSVYNSERKRSHPSFPYRMRRYKWTLCSRSARRQPLGKNFAHTQHACARVAMTSSTSTVGSIHRSDLFNPLTYETHIRYSMYTPTWGVWVNQTT